MGKLPRLDIIRICAIAGTDERAVRRLLRGDRTMPGTAERIRAAARELGIELPPPSGAAEPK